MTPGQIEVDGFTFRTREAVGSDLAYLTSTWFNSALRLRNCRHSIFDQFYPPVLRSFLESETVAVLVREGNDTIHGWACGRAPNLLHFAYIPHKLRGKGLGRTVIASVLEGYPATVYVTASPLSLPHHPRFVYNPFTRVS